LELIEHGAEAAALDTLVQMHADPYEAANGAHAIAVLTEWDVFATLDYARIYDHMQRPRYVASKGN